jgi:hypothetical protein
MEPNRIAYNQSMDAGMDLVRARQQQISQRATQRPQRPQRVQPTMLDTGLAQRRQGQVQRSVQQRQNAWQQAQALTKATNARTAAGPNYSHFAVDDPRG